MLHSVRRRILVSSFLLFAVSGTAFSQSTVSVTNYPVSDYVQQTEGKQGGILYASASYVTRSFDIHTEFAGNLLWQSRLVFDNLIYLDNKGEPTPWLARSWTVSPDGKAYTFKLRQGVTFSDGTPFDAEAVRANFDHIKKLAGRSRISAGYLSPYVEGVVIDAHTFEARLNAPYPAFLSFLAQTWLGFVSPRQIVENPGTIAARPIGTGPFTVAENEPGKKIFLKRRADYAWAPDYLQHKGAAYLDGIVIEGISDDAQRTAELQVGKQQLTFEAALADGPRLRADPNLVFSNRVRPGSPMRGLAFNSSRFPFDDVRIRRAVALAIDRDAVTKQLGAGEFIPKADYLGTNTPGYVADYQNVLAYNPQKASKLLDTAGWEKRDKDGIRIKSGRRLAAELLTTGNERTPPASVLKMQADLHAVGFELRLKAVPSAELIQLVSAGNYNALTGGWWSAATPDVLYLLYHSRQRSRQNIFGQDTARLGDHRLDGVLQRARETQDPEKRQTLYVEAQRLLTELVPVVPLHESHHLIAYSKKLHGVLFDTTHNTPLLIGAWLD